MPVTIAFPPRIKPYPTAGQSLGMGLEQVPGVATHGILSIIAQQLAKGGEEDKQKGIMNLAHEQNMERDQAKNAGDIQRDWLGAGAQTAGQKEVLMEQGRQQGISREGALAAELALQQAKGRGGPNYFKEGKALIEASTKIADPVAAGKVYRAGVARLKKGGFDVPARAPGEQDPWTKEGLDLEGKREAARAAEAKAKADAAREDKKLEGSWAENALRVLGNAIKGGPFEDLEERAKGAQAIKTEMKNLRPQPTQGGPAPAPDTAGMTYEQKYELARQRGLVP